MKKYAIVLYGSHGGELDRIEIEVRPDQDEPAVIGSSIISSVEEWTMSPGDMIKVETVE